MGAKFRLRSTSNWLLIALMAANVAFVVLHLTQGMAGNKRWLFDEERGYPELFMYLQEFMLVVMFSWLFWKGIGTIFLGWAGIGMFFLADDFLRAPDSLERQLDSAFKLSYLLGNKSHEYIELLVLGIFASFFSVFFAVAFLRSGSFARRASAHLMGMVIGLFLVGIVLDMRGLVLKDGLDDILTVLEDGGEMLFISLMVWYAFRLLGFAQTQSTEPAPGHIIRLKPALHYGVPLLGVLGLWLIVAQVYLSQAAHLPITQLPDNLRPMNVIFDDTLEFIGWRAAPESLSVAERGWGEPNDSYAVEFYWRILHPTQQEYGFYLYSMVDGQGVTGVDYPVGSAAQWYRPTYTWTPGEIFSDTVTLILSDNHPLLRDISIVTGAYAIDRRTSLYDIVPVTSSIDSLITLQHVALYDLKNRPHLPDEPQPYQLIFDNRIALKTRNDAQHVIIGDDIVISLYLEALENIGEDYTLFIHLVDEMDDIVAGFDTPQLKGELYTSTWAPGYLLDDEIRLSAPLHPGRYKVYAGLYNPTDPAERLYVDAPDYRPLIGEIEVYDGVEQSVVVRVLA